MSGKKRTVATGLLRLDQRLQCRDQVPEAIIKEYEDGWKSKVPFPPISAVQVDGELYVTDGFCRVMAAQNVGKSRVEAVVTVGTWKDAMRAACGANASHGLRRTNADKRKATEIALREFPDETIRAIAEMVGVSHTYVQNLRSPKEAEPVEPKAVAPVEPVKKQSATKPAAEESLDVVSPPGWRCSDCHGTEQRLSDGGYVCRACLLPVGESTTVEESEDDPEDAEPESEPEILETFPDPIPEKMAKVHADWGRFLRSATAAKCDRVLAKEIESITNKLKGLK